MSEDAGRKECHRHNWSSPNRCIYCVQDEILIKKQQQAIEVLSEALERVRLLGYHSTLAKNALAKAREILEK